MLAGVRNSFVLAVSWIVTGVSLAAFTIRADNGANENLHGKKVSASDIVFNAGGKQRQDSAGHPPEGVTCKQERGKLGEAFSTALTSTEPLRYRLTVPAQMVDAFCT